MSDKLREALARAHPSQPCGDFLARRSTPTAAGPRESYSSAAQWSRSPSSGMALAGDADNRPLDADSGTSYGAVVEHGGSDRPYTHVTLLVADRVPKHPRPLQVPSK